MGLLVINVFFLSKNLRFYSKGCWLKPLGLLKKILNFYKFSDMYEKRTCFRCWKLWLCNKYTRPLGCYPSLFRLGNICNPILVVIFHIDSLFLKIQGLPKIITTNCVQNEKKYANWFFCIINMYTKYTLAVCVFMFYWFFYYPSIMSDCDYKYGIVNTGESNKNNQVCFIRRMCRGVH